MNAEEVIRLIEALPPDERREVVEHMLRVVKPRVSEVRYASAEQMKEIAEQVFTTHEELFRKLAERCCEPT